MTTTDQTIEPPGWCCEHHANGGTGECLWPFLFQFGLAECDRCGSVAAVCCGDGPCDDTGQYADARCVTCCGH